MAFIINTFSVTDDQYLGGFMFYEESFDDFVRDGAIPDQVEVVKVNGFGKCDSFQPAFHQGTGTAAGAVFEYHLGAPGRFLEDLVQLCFGLKVYPAHNINFVKIRVSGDTGTSYNS